ncbi:Paired box protein Pax-7 [Liparis tanakae]|uniref:Paired box protein Pax-7 n=1 Tax=Liparis tanakae TaxID=230148 RepID=A0A4Z2DZ95_9TELE|nr:Paired box protein Pax-7 [Liparis tanakae]
MQRVRSGCRGVSSCPCRGVSSCSCRGVSSCPCGCRGVSSCPRVTPSPPLPQVMSILSNPGGVSSQPQHDFSPLHSALDSPPPNSAGCSQRAEASVKTVDSLPSPQSYCPSSYSTGGYGVDPAAGYQYSQYGQSESHDPTDPAR